MAAVNLLVTLSNLAGLLPIYAALKKEDLFGLIIMTVTVMASIMMHLSETKHSLPGLLFVSHSDLFLNIDRITAILASLYGVYLFFKNQKVSVLMLTSTGLIFMFISENMCKSKYSFAFFHSIWHILAYISLYLLIKNS